jgi:hypothetical protein
VQEDDSIVEIPKELFETEERKEEEVEVELRQKIQSEEEGEIELGSSPALSPPITGTEGETESDEQDQEDEDQEENELNNLKNGWMFSKQHDLHNKKVQIMPEMKKRELK